jgi:hypothetical protein
MPEIRKTVIVGINLHGEIQLDENNDPQIGEVKNNYIIKLNVATPGVPNISTIENYNRLGDVTKELIKKNEWLNEPMLSLRCQNGYKKRMLNFVNELKNEFIKENEDNVMGIEKVYYRKRSVDEILSTHQQNFVYNTGSMYKINKFNKCDPITNKLFLKFSEEELKQLEIKEDDNKRFNKILLYNFSDNENDMVDVFQLLGPEYTEITLFNLIDFLQGMGVENIIFIDLSCAVFTSENKLSKRDIRSTRRRLTKHPQTCGVCNKKENQY